MDLLDKLDWVRCHINEHAIYRVSDGEKPLKNSAGEEVMWEFHLKRSLYDPDILAILTEYFFHVAQDVLRMPLQLCGTDDVTPFITAVALETKKRGIELPVFSIRELPREWGIRNWIDGLPAPQHPVMLVGGHASQHDLEYCVRVLADHNANVFNHMMLLVDNRHQHERGPITLFNHEFKIVAPFNLSDFDLHDQDYRFGVSNYKALFEKNVYDQSKNGEPEPRT